MQFLYRESHALLPDGKERRPFYQLKELIRRYSQASREKAGIRPPGTGLTCSNMAGN